jgi:hypothetical protein
MTQRPEQSPLAAGFAHQVRLRRRALNISARELAEHCAKAGYPTLSREAISNMEVGRRQDITLDEAACLAHVLGELEESIGWGIPSRDEEGKSRVRMTWLHGMLGNASDVVAMSRRPDRVHDGPRSWLADNDSWLRPPPPVGATAMDQVVQLADRLHELLGRAYPGVRGDGVLLFDPNDAAQVADVDQFRKDHSDGEHRETT